MNTISLKDTLFAITEKHPETIDLFVSRGFDGMDDYAQRSGYGRVITLEMALDMKKIHKELFLELLEEAVDRKSSLRRNGDALTVTGLLPCPVRIPLQESFDRFVSGYQERSSLTIDAELKAASSGTGWVEDHLAGAESIDDLPDCFISAGFDLFFDRALIGRFRDEHQFADLVSWKTENPAFAGRNLVDPEGAYSVISAVPAIFLVNVNELGDRPVPGSWEELLNGDYDHSVSLPVGDFDLFNAILLTLRERYGDEALVKLGRVMLQGMHPSQMVKSERMKSNRPAVTIMPWFFTKTVREGGAMKTVWPSDGAVLSPIFMLTKKNKTEQLQPVADFFSSREVGEILAHQGLFPSLHPEVENTLPDPSPFMWLGWDYIRSHDLSAEIKSCEEIFNNAHVPLQEGV